jgi:hypothetical protein
MLVNPIWWRVTGKETHLALAQDHVQLRRRDEPYEAVP